VLGIVVGASPQRRLDRYVPGWRGQCTLVPAGVPYSQHAASPPWLALDPVYEAKCVPFLEPGDLLWVVGCRQTARPSVALPEWLVGDAARWQPPAADMVFTCPPYYDLERYSDDPADLSTMRPAEFDRAYGQAIANAATALRRDRFAVVVTGDVRDAKGALRDLRGVTIRAAEAAGLHYVSGAVLVTAIGSLPVRAARYFTATRTLGRTHQDVLVFVNGSRKAATAACGEVEVHIPDGLEEAGEEAGYG